MYKAVTRGIAVSVEPFFLEDQSDPDDDRYVWAYRIVIENGSQMPVRLVRRHWLITDENGAIEEVSGDGVVGEQPQLSPGDSYEYTSGCPLQTPSGIMTGRYEMEDEQGDVFDVKIPAFSLDLPGIARTLN